MHAFKTTDDEQISTTKNEQRSKNIAKSNKTFKIQKIEKKKDTYPYYNIFCALKTSACFF